MLTHSTSILSRTSFVVKFFECKEFDIALDETFKRSPHMRNDWLNWPNSQSAYPAVILKEARQGKGPILQAII